MDLQKYDIQNILYIHKCTEILYNTVSAPHAVWDLIAKGESHIHSVIIRLMLRLLIMISTVNQFLGNRL